MRLVTNHFRLFLAAFLFPVISFAEEAAHVAANVSPYAPLGVGLGIGIAVLGAALAQGRIAAAFMTGVARNPGAVGSMRTLLILSLVFVETLVLFTVLVVLLLLGKM